MIGLIAIYQKAEKGYKKVVRKREKVNDLVSNSIYAITESQIFDFLQEEILDSKSTC